MSPEFFNWTFWEPNITFLILSKTSGVVFLSPKTSVYISCLRSLTFHLNLRAVWASRTVSCWWNSSLSTPDVLIFGCYIYSDVSIFRHLVLSIFQVPKQNKNRGFTSASNPRPLLAFGLELSYALGDSRARLKSLNLLPKFLLKYIETLNTWLSSTFVHVWRFFFFFVLFFFTV